MGKLPPKYKGKSDKYPVLEDYIGTEIMKETYEDRKKVARTIDLQEAYVRDLRKKRLEEIRKKKVEELRKQLMDDEKLETINRQMSYVLYNMLEPAAYEFLDYLRKKDPEACSYIIKTIFTDYDMAHLNDYVELINRKGRPKKQVRHVYLVKLYRKMKNIKPTIQVEEDGKRVDLSEKFSPRKVA